MLTLNMARQHRRQSERSPSQRQLRVGELIRHALADMLTRGEVHDPVLDALERNKKFLRGEIARRINLKFAPDIRFRFDERFDEAERIEKILRTPEVRRDLERKPDGEEK